MTKLKLNKKELLRIVEGLGAYPAVLRPVPEGGFEVIFTNLAGVKSYGVKRETAMKAGSEILTAEIYALLHEGEALPAPSRPERLIPDEDDPPGTELVMLEPDKKILKKYLGLGKRERSAALKSLGVYGRQERG